MDIVNILSLPKVMIEVGQGYTLLESFEIFLGEKDCKV